jgi:hypothetical protein
MFLKRCFTSTVMLWALLFCLPSNGQEKDPAEPVAAEGGSQAFDRHVVFYKTAIANTQNPLGLASVSEIGYRYNLFDSDNVLLGDTHAALTFAPYLTPAFTSVGLKFKLKPLALLELSARYDVVNYFGNFGNLQSFESPNEPYDDDTLDERESKGLNKAANGSTFTLETLVQAKVGSIAARTAIKTIFTDFDLADDSVHYMPSLDVLVPSQGMTLSVDSDLLYVGDSGFTAGIRHTLIQPFYNDDDFLTGESKENINGPIHRLGTLLAYKFSKDKGTLFDEPTAFMLLQWYLKHRHRAGQDSSQLLPYFAVGFSFSGHIL